MMLLGNNNILYSGPPKITLTHLGSLDVSAQISTSISRQLSISEDGSKLSIIRYHTKGNLVWDLTQPYDISTASYLRTNLHYTFSTWAGIYTPDGMKYIYINTANTLYQKQCSSPFVFSGNPNISKNLGITGAYQPMIFFTPDGLKCFWTIYNSGKGVVELTLTNPYDISTATYTTKHVNYSNIGSVVFLKNGNYILQHQFGSNKLVLKQLSSPYDLSNPSADITSSLLDFTAFNVYMTYNNPNFIYTINTNNLVHQYKIKIKGI